MGIAIKGTKMKDISAYYGKGFDEVVKEMYCDNDLSSLEIAEKILFDTKIKISARQIQRGLKAVGVIVRSYRDRRLLAIKKGRMDYAPYRKEIKSSEFRKGINLKLRYEILKRDNFKCTLCGRTAKDDLLVIDHIKAVVNGGDNSPDNLRVLCRACNHGKMFYEERK